MTKEIVFVSTKKDILYKRLHSLLSNFDIKWFKQKDELFKHFQEIKSKPILISYNHNIIFPKWLLDKIEVGYNVHAAPPEYPGRDPHHFAIYDEVKEYGATLHLISEKVDNGPIILVSKFDCSNIHLPQDLLKIADEHALNLIEKLISMIANGKVIRISNLNWGPRKTTRKMFLEYCKINPLISKEELQKRIRAFNVKGYSNIKLHLHGYIFKLEEDSYTNE